MQPHEDTLEVATPNCGNSEGGHLSGCIRIHACDTEPLTAKEKDDPVQYLKSL